MSINKTGFFMKACFIINGYFKFNKWLQYLFFPIEKIYKELEGDHPVK